MPNPFCLKCGAPTKEYRRLYCSFTCFGRALHDKAVANVARRFWSRVQKTELCWLWTGERNQYGYGLFTLSLPHVGSHRVLAHRYAYELLVGPITDDLHVIHACDVRHCLNPAHLSLGTPSDNVWDAATKGRMARGERHHAARLTANDVRYIRAACEDITCRQKDLAARFSISRSSVCMIVSRKSWRHVP